MPPTSDSNLTEQRRKKSPRPQERKRRSDRSQQKDGVNKHSRPGERKRSPGADPSDDPSTRKRDEWKASTRTEGDSTEPSASKATRTCRKAGARDKHTGDVETTPCSARGEEDRSKQAPGKRPEERMGRLDSTIQTRDRQSGGRPPSRKLQEETTRRGEPLQKPDQEPWSDNDSKVKGKGKMGGKPPSRRTSHP